MSIYGYIQASQQQLDIRSSHSPPTLHQSSASTSELFYEEIDPDLDEHFETPYHRVLCKILYKGLGHRDWREGQLAATRLAVDGHNVFVMFPTGAGKSATYQVRGRRCSNVEFSQQGHMILFTSYCGLVHRTKVAGLYQAGGRQGMTVVFTVCSVFHFIY